MLVCRVTVAVEAIDPLGVTEAGLIVHVAPLGAPVHVSAMLAVIPPSGVMVRVFVAADPFVTLLELCASAIVNPGAVTVTVTAAEADPVNIADAVVAPPYVATTE